MFAVGENQSCAQYSYKTDCYVIYYAIYYAIYYCVIEDEVSIVSKDHTSLREMDPL